MFPIAQDTGGKEFIVVYLQNVVEQPNNDDLQLFVTTVNSNVQVSVTSPKYTESWAPNIDQAVPANEVVKFGIDYRLRLNENAKESKAILVQSNEDIIVYGVNMERFSSDGFLAIPTDSLSTEYYTVSYTPATTNCVFGIAGILDGSRVTIRLPPNQPAIQIPYNGWTYASGDTITITLDRYDTFQVVSKGDLTGTRIISSNPIAVFSGNVRTSTDGKNSRDHLVEQIPPISSWGKQFMTYPIPGRTAEAGGDYFRIVASLDNTDVTVQGDPNMDSSSKAFTLSSAGDFKQISAGSDFPLRIDATKGILVVQIAKSEIHGTADRGDPAMIIIPPTEQYDFQYNFLTPTYSGASTVTTEYSNTLMIIIQDNVKGGLRYDGENFQSKYPSATWKTIPGNAGYVGTVVSVTGTKSHEIVHESRVPFMAILYGYADRETYGIPVGMRLATIGAVSLDTLISFFL